MKNIIERIVGGAKIARYLPKAVSTRLAIAALAALAAGGAWADTQVAYSWDNLSASGPHNQSSTKVAWSITLPATAMSPSGSTVNITNLIFCSRNNALSGTDPRYFKITVGTSDYTSEVLNGTGAFSGQTVATTGTVGSYPKLEFKFTTPVPLVVETPYTLTPLDQDQTFTSGTTTIGAKLVQSRDSRSAVTMGGQGDGYYPICIVQGYATISTRVFTSAPSGAAVNFSDLTWEEAGAAATLPVDGDYTDCIFDVTMPDGGALTLDADISNLSGFIVRGASASLVFDTTKSYSVTSWDFSGLSGNVTLNNFPSAPTADNPILPAGGVVFTGSGTLANATVPYGSIPQSKSVTVSQNIVDADNGLQLAYNKGSFNFTGNNTIGCFVLGNQDDSVQVVNQLGGTTTVTGSNPPTSNQASVLLGHYSRTQVTFNNYAGVFSALNASSRLGWNDTLAIWNVGRGSGSDTATVKVKGIKTGTDSTDGYTHTGAGTLNINSNGILELGEDGIEMARNAGKINLAGGTIKATADTQIANNKADWTILNQGKTTTLDTGNHTMTLSAPLSGSGQLTKTGSGDLIVTGSGAATGLTEIKGGRLILSGNEAKVGSGNFNIKPGQGNSATLAIVPGEDNTITLTSQYLVNSTDGNPYLEIGAGTVKYTRTGNTAGNGCTASCTINILSGGTFELAGGDLLGWNYSFPINVASGGKLLISARETFTRNLNLNGGTLEISGANSGRALDLHNGMGIITATADSAINGVATESVPEPLIWIRSADASMAVNAGATLSLNAVVASANGETRNLTKSGAGTLKLMKANTCAGNLNVSGGTLDFDVGGSWAGTISPEAGTTLKFESGAAPAVASLALPASGTVTVDVSALTLGASGTTLMTFTTAPSATDVASKMTAAGAVLKLENSALKAYPIAAVVEANGTAHYCDNLSAAMSAAIITYSSTYDHFEIFSSIGETVYLDSMWLSSGAFKLKCLNDAAVTVQAVSAEYTAQAGAPDENGIVTYTGGNAATTYTWNWSSGMATWNRPSNWTYGTGTAATRAPVSGDTVIFNDGAAVTLAANAECAAMTVNGAVAISGNYGLNVSGNVTGGTGTPVLSISSADLNLSALSSVSGVALVLADSAATVLATTGATLAAVPTTTVEDSYVKTTLNIGATTYSVDTYKTVTFAGSNFSVAVTTNSQAVAVANNACTVEAGAISFTITPSSGYHVTAVTPSSGSVSGEGPYAYTVSGDATITVTTALDSSVAIGEATFVYGVDYTNATVTVAVTETNASGVEYTLTIGDKNYTANAVGGTTVTFNDVEVPRGSAYGAVGYTITSDATTTTGGGAREAAVADVTADWINERAASATGTSASAEGAGGTWTNAVTYTDGTAAISDNRFVATTASTASRVILAFEVCFSSTSEDDVSGEAQAAIKLGEVNSVTTFMVLTNANEWAAISNAALTPNASETNKVVLTIDYGSNTYGVTVNGHVMKDAANSESFPLAASKTSVQTIDFAGSGTLTSMKGDQVEGYMVKDNVGNRYATIQEATQAYNSVNGPYTVLHDGTAPSGWKIDETTKALIKLAKGFFFMAY